jgi:UDP-glucose:O-linked fucose beta-1,3-glucosyltransferase
VLCCVVLCLQAAQEREELQVAGDALDARITKAEAEVAMLSNTLSQMQATNVAFSTSLRQGDTKATQQERNALRCAYWLPSSTVRCMRA